MPNCFDADKNRFLKKKKTKLLKINFMNRRVLATSTEHRKKPKKSKQKEKIKPNVALVIAKK